MNSNSKSNSEQNNVEYITDMIFNVATETS